MTNMNAHNNKKIFGTTELLSELMNIINNTTHEPDDEPNNEDTIEDESLSMFSRKKSGTRNGAFRGDNSWNHLKKSGRKFKYNIRNEDNDSFDLDEAYEDMCNIMQESKIRKSASVAVSGMRKHNTLDNSSPYAPWRFGIALAGAPDFDMDKEGPSGQKLVTIAYTDAESDIISATEKFMGISGTNMSPKGSDELKSTNKLSPVPKFKRNKYGI